MPRLLLRVFGLAVLASAGIYASSMIPIGEPKMHRVEWSPGIPQLECPLDSQGRLHGEMKQYDREGNQIRITDMCHGQVGRGVIWEASFPKSIIADDEEETRSVGLVTP